MADIIPKRALNQEEDPVIFCFPPDVVIDALHEDLSKCGGGWQLLVSLVL